MTVSRSISLRMRTVSDKSCRQNQNTHFMFNDFFSKIVPFMRLWNNMVQPEMPQLTMWHMRFARWINEATNTHLEYVILIAVPQQQWLCKHTPQCYIIHTSSILLHTYIVAHELDISHLFPALQNKESIIPSRKQSITQDIPPLNLIRRLALYLKP
jgi:hypothetical protein